MADHLKFLILHYDASISITLDIVCSKSDRLLVVKKDMLHN